MDQLPDELKTIINSFAFEKNPNLIKELHKFYFQHQYDEQFENTFKSADIDEEGNILFYDD